MKQLRPYAFQHVTNLYQHVFDTAIEGWLEKRARVINKCLHRAIRNAGTHRLNIAAYRLVNERWERARDGHTWIFDDIVLELKKPASWRPNLP